MAQAPSRTETRGTAAVAKAFFTAAAAIPEALRPAVVKGALAKIRSDLAAQKAKAGEKATKAPAKAAKPKAAAKPKPAAKRIRIAGPPKETASAASPAEA